MWIKLKINPLDKYVTVINVDAPMLREIVQHMVKNTINVVVRTTSVKNSDKSQADSARDPASLSQSVTQKGQVEPMESACINAEYMR